MNHNPNSVTRRLHGNIQGKTGFFRRFSSKKSDYLIRAKIFFDIYRGTDNNELIMKYLSRENDADEI